MPPFKSFPRDLCRECWVIGQKANAIDLFHPRASSVGGSVSLRALAA
jgi:hypothetical protein